MSPSVGTKIAFKFLDKVDLPDPLWPIIATNSPCFTSKFKLSIALNKADRVVVVDKGKKLLEGTPKEVFKNVDLLKKIGLDVPYMTELAGLLREEGLDIDDDILTVDEMVDKLCQL